MVQVFLPLLFILGTAIGSFLNVVAYRSVHGGSIFFTHSICPHCKKRLKPADLIPIVSYILLRGRCRYCGKKISLQYPLVEFAAGITFAFSFVYWYQGYSINSIHLVNLVYLLFVVSVLLVLFTTDIVDGVLPNSIVLPAIIGVAAYKIFLIVASQISVSVSVYDLTAAFLVAAAFFAIVYFSGERALGGGDVKLVFLIGLATGLPAFIVALYGAFLTGGLASAMLLLTGRKRFGQTVPLGPFLAIGALLALFWGQPIIDFYLRVIS